MIIDKLAQFVLKKKIKTNVITKKIDKQNTLKEEYNMLPSSVTKKKFNFQVYNYITKFK